MPKRVPQFKPRAFGSPSRPTRRPPTDRTLLDIYSRAPWRRFRLMIRRERILCERCSTPDCPVVGTEVHHLISPRERPDLTYDPSNVELLCESCHSRETARQGRRPPTGGREG